MAAARKKRRSDSSPAECRHTSCLFSGPPGLLKNHEEAFSYHRIHFETSRDTCPICKSLIASGGWNENPPGPGKVGHDESLCQHGCGWYSNAVSSVKAQQSLRRHERAFEPHAEHFERDGSNCTRCRDLVNKNHWSSTGPNDRARGTSVDSGARGRRKRNRSSSSAEEGTGSYDVSLATSSSQYTSSTYTSPAYTPRAGKEAPSPSPPQAFGLPPTSWPVDSRIPVAAGAGLLPSLPPAAAFPPSQFPRASIAPRTPVTSSFVSTLPGEGPLFTVTGQPPATSFVPSPSDELHAFALSSGGFPPPSPKLYSPGRGARPQGAASYHVMQQQQQPHALPSPHNAINSSDYPAHAAPAFPRDGPTSYVGYGVDPAHSARSGDARADQAIPAPGLQSLDHAHAFMSDAVADVADATTFPVMGAVPVYPANSRKPLTLAQAAMQPVPLASPRIPVGQALAVPFDDAAADAVGPGVRDPGHSPVSTTTTTTIYSPALALMGYGQGVAAASRLGAAPGSGSTEPWDAATELIASEDDSPRPSLVSSIAVYGQLTPPTHHIVRRLGMVSSPDARGPDGSLVALGSLAYPAYLLPAPGVMAGMMVPDLQQRARPMLPEFAVPQPRVPSIRSANSSSTPTTNGGTITSDDTPTHPDSESADQPSSSDPPSSAAGSSWFTD